MKRRITGSSILIVFLVCVLPTNFVSAQSADAAHDPSPTASRADIENGSSAQQRSPLTPANPNASEDAERILRWLVDLPNRPDQRVVVGQHIGAVAFETNYGIYVGEVHRQTNKYVGLIGANYSAGMGYNLKEKQRVLVDFWNNGGLVTIHWRPTLPPRNVNLKRIITPGTVENDAFLIELNQAAEVLSELQQAGVVVLWRPFPEMNWEEPVGAWWQGRDRQEFINLWRYTFDWLTGKGLNNLLWVYSVRRPNMGVTSADYYYPGNDYVDITGMSAYNLRKKGLDGMTKEVQKLVDFGKPFGLMGTGPTQGNGDDKEPFVYDYSQLMDEIRAKLPDTTYFLTWNSTFAIINQLGTSALMNDEWAVIRDDIDWKSGSAPAFDPIIDDTDSRFSLQSTWGEYICVSGQHHAASLDRLTARFLRR